MTPGEKLQALRERLGLSLRQAAERTGGAISYSTIRNLESHDGAWEHVEIGSLRALARAYEMPLLDLLQINDQDGGVDPNDLMRHLAKRVDLERSAAAAAAAVRDEMRGVAERLAAVEEHLVALEAELERLRLR